jgi:anti-sigma regulatory factor (Ser/Thr protein kinase)
MPTLEIPNDASIHTLKNFLSVNASLFESSSPAKLRLHPTWAYMDPLALSMTAAWGGWCQRSGLKMQIDNMAGTHINYAARMRLFQHLGVPCTVNLEEHEEAGRFVPITQVKTSSDLETVIANVSALLHLDREPNGLAAVRYCVSELIRNVQEHSSSPEGAYVCAQRYSKDIKRVTIAVADCGSGISQHLGREYPQALTDSRAALQLAMRPGITGAPRGMYGAPDNAGAGLFITRAISKATGGYFVLVSGDAAFRLRRPRKKEGSQLQLFLDAYDDPRADMWKLSHPWQGTVAAVEIFTEEIPNFPSLFQWIRKQLPAKKTAAGKIKFT